MTLIGYWPLNESSGSTAYDHSGNSHHGTIYDGSDSTVPGASGPLRQNAYNFDGNNDYVEIDNFPSLESSISVSAWIKSTSGDNYTNIWNAVSRYNQFILGPEDGEMSFIVYTPNNGWTYLNPPTTPNKDRWHHFVGAWSSDTGKCKLWMDGKLFTSSSFTAEDPSSDTGPIDIGHREAKSQGTDHLQARISEVRIYDRAITPSEVQYLYQVGKRGLQTTSKKSS